MFQKTIYLLLLWIISTLVSDIINQSNFNDAIKGTFSLVLFLADLYVAYWLLSKNYKIIKYYLYGYTISFIIGALFGLDAFYQELLREKGLYNVAELGHYYKVITWVLTAFIAGPISISFFKKKPITLVIIIICFSFFALYQGSRSIFLIMFITSIFTISIIYITKRNKIEIEKIYSLKNKYFFRLLLLLIISSIIATKIYEVSASNGYLGKEEQRKYEIQNSSKIGLLAGRGAVVAAMLSIWDSPILGHGSYAIDYKGYGIRAAYLTGTDYREIVELNSYLPKQIPTHSHILQAWVYNGILGALFWCFVISILYKFLVKHIFKYPDLCVYLFLSIMINAWNIFFSGFSQRPFLAVSLMLIIILIRDGNEIVND